MIASKRKNVVNLRNIVVFIRNKTYLFVTNFIGFNGFCIIDEFRFYFRRFLVQNIFQEWRLRFFVEFYRRNSRIFNSNQFVVYTFFFFNDYIIVFKEIVRKLHHIGFGDFFILIDFIQFLFPILFVDEGYVKLCRQTIRSFITFHTLDFHVVHDCRN